jgi:phosphoglycolate phosphatase-like HAD superfamily hydrolase
VPDLIPVFDLDGTLLDSDTALVAPFLALGVTRDEISFGHVIGAECTRLGIDVADYVRLYDTEAVQPFPGVTDLVAGLDRWAVCSNKHPASGRAELARLGWNPEVACFTDAFGGGPKELTPVLDRMGLQGHQVLFIGDTSHDRVCAARVGAVFALAAWNPRAVPEPGDVVLRTPGDVVRALLET